MMSLSTEVGEKGCGRAHMMDDQTVSHTMS